MRQVAAGVVVMREVFPPMCFATSGCSCVNVVLKNAFLESSFFCFGIDPALEWLHDCCRFGVARTSIDRCRFATGVSARTHCSGCVKVALVQRLHA